MSKTDDLALIAQQIRRVRMVHAPVAILVSVATLVGLFIWGGELSYRTTPDIVVFWMVIGGGLIANAMFWALAAPSLRAEKSPLLRALRDAPQSVIWVYDTATTTTVAGIPMPNASHDIAICLADGKVRSIRWIAERHVAALWAAVARLAPNARFGFTAENQAYFLQAKLRRR